MTILCRNMLIKRQCDKPEPRVERILAIDNSSSQVLTIQLTKERVRPQLCSYQEIIFEIETGDSCITEDDPFVRLLVPEELLSESQRRDRDTRWQLISQLPLDDFEFMLYGWKRGPLIRKIAELSGKHKDYIYNVVRRYYQGGMTINAVSPDFDKRGGPGKQRVVEEQDGRKFGRSSSLEKAQNKVLKIKLTLEIVRCFERGIRKFLSKGKDGKYNIKEAYERIIETFFIRLLSPSKGIDDPHLLPAEERPKLRQFEYWVRRYGLKLIEVEGRSSNYRPRRARRAVLGDSTEMAFGPGSLYQVDATIANIYLVSSLDRLLIVGRPVLYFIMDVFSRMIVGMAIALEGPSWRCAMLAVDNIVEDKVQFCKKYGITIDSSEWPCNRLGEGFLADRGEFEGYNPEPLIKNCRQAVHNTPPYRGDLKGIIERNFGRVDERTVKFAPGYVNRDHNRGDPDYRLEAAVRLEVFTRSIIRYVLWYNNNYYMNWYNMKEFAIRDKVKRYPIDLWEWGIRNRSGNFGHVSRDTLRKNILPHKEVSITEAGIHFGNDIYYTCETAVREQWFERAADKRWKEVASYKYDSMDNIYIWLDGGKRLEECYLLDRVKDPFAGRSLYEIEAYYDVQLQDREASQTRQQQTLATLHAQNRRDFAEEVEKTQEALEAVGPISKRSRISKIGANRRAEKEFERQKAAGLHREAGNPETLAEVVPLVPRGKERPSGNYVPPDEDIEELRELREEAWSDEK